MGAAVELLGFDFNPSLHSGAGKDKVAGRLTSPDSSFQMLVFDAGKAQNTNDTPEREILELPEELERTVSLEREPEEYVPTPISHLVSFSIT